MSIFGSLIIINIFIPGTTNPFPVFTTPVISQYIPPNVRSAHHEDNTKISVSYVTDPKTGKKKSSSKKKLSNTEKFTAGAAGLAG